MYLVCRPLRGHFPPGSKSKPVSPRAATVVGNTASPQVARSQESLTLTFCFGSYIHKTFYPGSPLSFLYPSRLGQTPHHRGFPKTQAGSDPCGLPPWPQRGPQLSALPLPTCWLVFHPMMGLWRQAPSSAITPSPRHSLTQVNTHYLLSTGAIRN